MNVVVIDSELWVARRQLEDIHVVTVTNGQSDSGFVGCKHVVVGYYERKGINTSGVAEWCINEVRSSA